MPLQATSGAASYDAFGGGVAAVPNYIEDVFSTWLYTGNGSTQTINNGIDLAGKGGLVWIKGRSGSFGSGFHLLQDSARGFGNSTALSSNSTDAQYSSTGIIQSVSSTGFTSGASGLSNASSTDYVSWTFREQPKFFDVVTWTGNGAAGSRTLNHNLGAVPGCIIVKRTDAAGYWAFSHTATPSLLYALNSTAAGTGVTDTAGISANGYSFLPDATATTFRVSPGATDAAAVNANGGTYVAYLFAHNAGGFGLTGTDNVISCGSFTASSGAATVDLGYEPQWILFKRTNGAEGWNLVDNMRGWSYSATALLQANTSGAEDPNGLTANPTATGFQFGTGTLAASGTYIYIAIRRGPMRTPTTGTSVFAAQATAASTNGTALQPRYTSNFPLDLIVQGYRSGSGANSLFMDRLRGAPATGLLYLVSSNTNAEGGPGNLLADTMNGVYVNGGAGADSTLNAWMFRRAPGFFDVVCYTGTGSATTQTHNLGVAPELTILKRRSTGGQNWVIGVGNTTNGLNFNTDPYFTFTGFSVTATTFTVPSDLSGSGQTFVAYLFASCPGVSKVFNYTGNGSSQTINCGFTGGARFVMIKRTDSTGDWYVWDSARGIVSGNDPRLSINSTAAEVTTDDSVDTDSTGFVVNQLSATNINVSSATYIGLAIA